MNNMRMYICDMYTHKYTHIHTHIHTHTLSPPVDSRICMHVICTCAHQCPCTCIRTHIHTYLFSTSSLTHLELVLCLFCRRSRCSWQKILKSQCPVQRAYANFSWLKFSKICARCPGHTHTHKYTYTYTYAHIYMYISMCVRERECVCVYTHTHARTHTCIYT